MAGSLASVTVVVGLLVVLLYLLYSLLAHKSSLSLHDDHHSIPINSLETKLADSVVTEDVWKAVKASALQAKFVYVIPGGGSSYDINDPTESDGYPLWTKQRVEAAAKHYASNHREGEAVFLALSAGSLNSPNKRQASGNIVFECQHIIKHLKQLGVDEEAVFGDFISWDTVGIQFVNILPILTCSYVLIGNGLTLRLFIEGLLSTKRSARVWNGNSEASTQLKTELQGPAEADTIEVEVFISDFHAHRVQKTFEWVLGLSPSLLDENRPHIVMRVHSVSSMGVKWKSKKEFEDRIAHEERGVAIIGENAKQVTSLSGLFAFLLLGPHAGIYRYLHDAYMPSKGGGW